MNRERLAWAAGLVDGEGCFTSHAMRGKPYPRLVVSQYDDPEVL